MNRRYLMWIGWGVLGVAAILWETQHRGTQPTDVPNPEDTTPPPSGTSGGGGSTVIPTAQPYSSSPEPAPVYQAQQYPTAPYAGQLVSGPSTVTTETGEVIPITKTVIRPGIPLH